MKKGKIMKNMIFRQICRTEVEAILKTIIMQYVVRCSFYISKLTNQRSFIRTLIHS